MHNADTYFGINYAWTGIIYDRSDLNKIADVIPGSPAYNAGLRRGDKINGIMDEKMGSDLSTLKAKVRQNRVYAGMWYNLKEGTLKALRYLYIFETLDAYPDDNNLIPSYFKPYSKGIPRELEFSVEQNGKKTKLKIKPLKKDYYNYFTIK
ncbi:MAG: hypothetical protein IPH18_12055 [Chitinophagaceae bacterium]|nr:hypothetical protein [Chitinophagaceae bacterium]